MQGSSIRQLLMDWEIYEVQPPIPNHQPPGHRVHVAVTSWTSWSPQ